MNKKIFLPVVSIVLAVAMLSFIDKEDIKTLDLGQKAPMADVKMKNIDGQKSSLESLNQENGLVVVFSCNTCPFVIGGGSFGGWEKVYNEYAQMAKEKKIGFVLINSNEAKRDAGDNMKDMIERAKEKKYSMPYLMDNDSKLANAFGAKTTPHIFMFTKDMELVYKGSIDNSWDSKRDEDVPYLKNAMEQLVSGRKISTPSSAPKGCSIKRK